MKTIKFELDEEPVSFCNPQHVIAEISLSGDEINDYLQAFKAFLIACGFAESTVSEITTKEEAILDWQEENTHLTDCE